MKNRLFMTNVNQYLKGFLVDSINDYVDEIDFENSLLEVRRITGAKNIEIIPRYIGDRIFLFIHGVMENGKASAISPTNDILMINPIIVVGYRKLKGGYEMRSLTDEEIGHIKDNIGLMFIHDEKTGGCNSYCLLNVGTSRPMPDEDEDTEEE